MRLLILCCLTGGLALNAADPRCESSPEVRRTLQEKSEAWRHMTYAERIADEDAVYAGLILEHPGDLNLQFRRFMAWIGRNSPKLPALRDRLVVRAESEPENASAQYLAGHAQMRFDADEGMRRLQRAVELDPALPQAWLTLAIYHRYGRFTDKQRSSADIEAYFEACPAGLDSLALSYLSRVGTPELQKTTAKLVRERLAKEADPERLRLYEHIWSIEFRQTPPTAHDTVRETLRADIERLNSIVKRPDSRWLKFLADAYRQAGREEDSTAAENRIIEEFPKSYEAFRLIYSRWDKANKTPENDAPTEEWDAFQKTKLRTTLEWARDFPDTFARRLPSVTVMTTANPDLQLAGKLIQDGLAYDRSRGPGYPPNYFDAAQFFLKHGLDAEQALIWVDVAEEATAGWQDRSLELDYASEEELENTREVVRLFELMTTELRLRAWLALDRAADAENVRTVIEREVPDKPGSQWRRWSARGLLAEFEGSKADALTYYQQALHTRPEPPKRRYGWIDDPLLDDARRLWTELGGTEIAFEIWRTKPESGGEELSDGRWEEPKEDLPPFELADLSGKTWALRKLEGKTLLINLWAAWCGPCRSEMPHFQKLYDRTKDRTDVTLLSFNIDDELGLVQPFVKEHGYTFPVIPAYDYVNGVLDSVSIPRNWIVDAAGKWRLQQIGFDSFEPEWEKSMLEKMDSLRPDQGMAGPPPQGGRNRPKPATRVP